VSLRNAAGAAITVLVVAAWWLVFRPVALGGPAAYLVVHGTSMSGTYAPGDIVMTMRRARYEVGEVVVYVSPDAQSGQLVVHRVVAIDGEALITRGDAVADDDPWQTPQDSVRGLVVVHLPLGSLLQLLETSHGIAGMLGGLACIAVLRLRRPTVAVAPTASGTPLALTVALACALALGTAVAGWAASLGVAATSLSGGTFACDQPAAPPAAGDSFDCTAIG
jgi:signal peptidase I